MGKNDLGKVEVKPRQCQVAERKTFRIIYTVGEREISAGGGVRFLLPNNWTFPQDHDPAKDGFSRIECPSSVKGETNIVMNSAYFALTEGTLKKGDKVLLIYAAKTSVLPTAKVPDAGAFWAAVSFAKDKEFSFIEPPTRVEVRGGVATRIFVHLPSFAPRVSKVEGKVAAVDDYGNPDEQFSASVALDGHTLRFEKSDKGRKTFTFPTEGPDILILKAECREKEIRGVSNPVEVEYEPRELNLYWGDIHVHSQLSDALGAPADGYIYARQVAGLDFAAAVDHDWVLNESKRHPRHAMDETGWEETKRINDKFYEPGKFVTLLGYEWIREEKGKPGSNFGHMNIYYRNNDGPFFPPDKTRSDDPRQIAELLRDEEALLIPHQTLYSSPDLLTNPIKSIRMPLVEIYSGWGSSEAVDGLLINEPVRQKILKRKRKGESVQEYLAFGYRFGFFSSSDNHLTLPGIMPKKRVAYSLPTSHRGGLAAVYAKELTRESIYDALKNRQVYAVTGARIILEFFVNEHFMGSEIKATSAPRKIRSRVIGNGALAKVELIKNNRVLKSWEEPGGQNEFTFEDNKKEKDVDYYYLRVVQQDGEMAWSSPVWVES